MPAIGADGSYPKWELLHHIVDEVDGIRLGVPTIDLECTDSRSVVDRRDPGPPVAGLSDWLGSACAGPRFICDLADGGAFPKHVGVARWLL